MSKKSIALMMALTLLIGCVVGGTVAWLMDNTSTVTNTFTVGNINIDLKETVNGTDTSAADTAVTNDSFKIVPGAVEAKNPKVIVEEKSENCYVFVQVKEVGNTAGTGKYVDWLIAEGWTQLGTASNGVYTYYRTTNYTTVDNETSYNVLAGGTDANTDGQVSYPSALTKADMDALSAAGATQPQLIFKAFAVQSDNLTDQNSDNTVNAADAWELVAANQKLS